MDPKAFAIFLVGLCLICKTGARPINEGDLFDPTSARVLVDVVDPGLDTINEEVLFDPTVHPFGKITTNLGRIKVEQ